MKKLIIAGALMAMSGSWATASQIERACIKSDRQAASRALCGCIQDVADLTLSTADQKLAATFFKTPQKAQDIRQSNNSRNESFWDRYKEFGAVASQFCASS